MSDPNAETEAGRAVLSLIEQIFRLRKRPCPSMKFGGMTPEDTMAALEDELREVREEEKCSKSAQAETAGVIATAVHLAIAHGADPVSAIAYEANKLCRRMDLVEAGHTWEEAKRLESSTLGVIRPLHYEPSQACERCARRTKERDRATTRVLRAEARVADLQSALDAHSTNWLRAIYILSSLGAEDDALKLLLGHLSDMLDARDFQFVDEILQIVDVERLSSKLLVGILTITLTSKKYLPSRNSLFVVIEKRLERVAPEHSEQLLLNLR